MRKHTLAQKYLAIGLCLLAGFMLLRTFELGPWKGAKDRINKIPLNSIEHLGFLTLEARVNGKPVRMLTDTAASLSILDISLIEELKLNSVQRPVSVSRLANGEVPIEFAHVRKFKLGKLSYNGEFAFIDLSRTLKGSEVAGETPIQGLLGSEFLNKWETQIDYRDMCLTIRKP